MYFPISEAHRIAASQLDVSPRLLLGPGPSNAHPRVLQAIGMRQVGHLDPQFVALMTEVQELLRYAWQTENRLTIPVSGTGSAAMEATIANLVEPGDKVLVGCNGYFGLRMEDMAKRYGADVKTMKAPWGKIFSLEDIKKAVKKHKPIVLGLVHAETSTGAWQPLEGVAEVCRENGCLLLIDTVTSLGGVPLLLDHWGVDAAYSGSQKCLSCPPGISPFTLGPRGQMKLDARTTPVANWYLDMTMVGKYWGSERTYHHTAPINMVYAFREALRLVAEEGITNRWERHQSTAEIFWAGLADLGLKCHVAKSYRLPSLTTVKVPRGINPKAVTSELLNVHNIEIANGLGELGGKVWRVGLMGHNSRPENAYRLLDALGRVLAKQRK